MKDKVKPRDKKSMIFGILGGVIILVALTFFFLYVVGKVLEILPEDFRMVGIFSYLSGLLFISSFIAGYIAGNPKFGLKSGLIFFIVFLKLVILLYPMLTGYLIFILPFAVILCVASGYYGGLSRDRRKLYPLIKEESFK